MNDRFLIERSPLDAKYKRSLEGKVLDTSTSTSTSNASNTASSSSPRSSALLNRERIYKRILFQDCTDSSKDDSAFFIAPILYPSINTTTTTGSTGSSTNNLNNRKRILQSTPIKVLDAPGLEDDFYQNLLDWDHRSNRLAVLLNGTEVYFWNASALMSRSTGGTSSLGRARATATQAKACVVKVEGDKLALGLKSGSVEIWDHSRGVQSTCFQGHPDARCGVLSWQSPWELSSGGRDGRVVHYDLRYGRGIVGESRGHSQEICGLKWNNHNCASGGNDNLLMVWDKRCLSRPLLKLAAHCAAVKALAWSPHQSGFLASGGGTADRTIRFWNVRRAVPLWTESPVEGFGSSPLTEEAPQIPEQLIIQASSQVCTLAWSPLRADELLSTHGFSEHNLALWSYPGGKCLGRFEGHSQRVLFQATGPDGCTVATGSGDQSIRFWNVFRAAGRGVKKQASQGLDSILFR